METIRAYTRIFGQALVLVLALALSAGWAAASHEDTRQQPTAKATAEKDKDDEKEEQGSDADTADEDGKKPAVNTVEDLYASPACAAELLLEKKPATPEADAVLWREVD